MNHEELLEAEVGQMRYVAASRLLSDLSGFYDKVRKGVPGVVGGVNSVYSTLLDMRPKLKEVALDDLGIEESPQIAKTDGGVVILQTNGFCAAVSRAGTYLTEESQKRLNGATEYLKGEGVDSSFSKDTIALAEKMVEAGLLEKVPYTTDFFIDRAYNALKGSSIEERKAFAEHAGGKPTKKTLKELPFDKMLQIMDGVLKKEIFTPYEDKAGYKFEIKQNISLTNKAPDIGGLLESHGYKMSKVEGEAMAFMGENDERSEKLLNRLIGGDGRVSVGVLEELHRILYEIKKYQKELKREIEIAKNERFLSSASSSPWFMVKNKVKYTCSFDAPSEFTREVVNKKKAPSKSKELGLETKKSIRLVGLEKDLPSLSLAVETLLAVSDQTITPPKKEIKSDKKFTSVRKL